MKNFREKCIGPKVEYRLLDTVHLSFVDRVSIYPVECNFKLKPNPLTRSQQFDFVMLAFNLALKFVEDSKMCKEIKTKIQKAGVVDPTKFTTPVKKNL